MNNSPQRLLIIDENAETHEQVRVLLEPFGYGITNAYSFSQGRDLIKGAGFDLVLLELDYEDRHDGIALIQMIEESRPGTSVFVASSQGDIRRCVKAMEAGAREYLIKPIEPESLFSALNRVFQITKVQAERSRLLSENVEFFEAVTTYQTAARLLEIEDMEALMDAALDLMAKEGNALGSVLWLQDRAPQGPLVLKRARGLLDVSKEPGSLALDAAQKKAASSLNSQTNRPAFGLKPDGTKDESVLWIGLKMDDRAGLVKITEPSEGERFGEASVTTCQIIASFLQLALAKLYRIVRAERHLQDFHNPLAYNINYFADLADKEIGKSQRYHRALAVVHLRVDNTEAIRKHFSEGDYEQSVRGILEASRNTLRNADFIGRADASSYFFLLPETDFFGSMICIQRVRRAVAHLRAIRDESRSLPILMSFSSSAFPTHGKNFAELKEAAEKRMVELKNSIYQRMSLEDRTFRQSLDRLVGAPEDFAPIRQYQARQPLDEQEPPLVLESLLEMSEDEKGLSRHLTLNTEELEDMVALMAQEVHGHPERRGVLFLGTEAIRADHPLLMPFRGLKKSHTGVYFVGPIRSGASDWLGQEITLVSARPEEIGPYTFMVFLNEDFGFFLAFRQDEAAGGWCGFHSADAILIENMIGKIQSEYLIAKGARS